MGSSPVIKKKKKERKAFLQRLKLREDLMSEEVIIPPTALFKSPVLPVLKRGKLAGTLW